MDAEVVDRTEAPPERAELEHLPRELEVRHVVCQSRSPIVAGTTVASTPTPVVPFA